MTELDGDFYARQATERLNRMFGAYLAERDGSARQATWYAEDGWWVVYTTERVRGGKHDGAFVAQLFRPSGKNAMIQDDRRVCATRREAKRRATLWFAEHSPKWAARHEQYVAGLK